VIGEKGSARKQGHMHADVTAQGRTLASAGLLGHDFINLKKGVMMFPASRIGDPHVCPMVTGIIPHVGGPIVSPGAPTVLIGGMVAATVGSTCTCVGPPDSVLMGSSTVLLCNKPAARITSNCAHGGMVVMGMPTVLIGG
jgi:uncharacterized Zn-binding protein involved in type VI secretion